jgi:cysteine desulfurase
VDPVYFDHNATTPLDERVLEAMLPYLRAYFGNASSRHELGTRARKAVERAREQVAGAIGAQPSQVVFVSGGSEANNLFIKGAAAFLKSSQILVSAVEHPCVAKPAQELIRQGWECRRIAVDKQGRLDFGDYEAALTRPTGIVSVMLANNETGVIQDVVRVAEWGRAAGAWVHSDAVQALGKMEVDFRSLRVHALTLSAHKVYGPKGAAALVLDKRVSVKGLISGGGHEGGLRAGTENVPAIVGMGVACELATARWREDAERLARLRDRLERGVAGLGAVIFGAGAARIPNTSYFAFEGIDGETLVIELDRLGFCVASGSACSSLKTGPSEVLLAMGVAPELARGAVRVSLGRGNTQVQVEAFLEALGGVVARLRRLSALAL